MRKVNIWCDASQRRVEQTELNPKGRKVSFAAWIADTGYCWYDLVYAKRSNEAELTAVFVALHWALCNGYQEITIYTDNKSIPESLYSKNKGKGLGDLPLLIEESTAEIIIKHIPRKENQAAHRLCNQAFSYYSSLEKIPHGGKKTRSYLTCEVIAHAQKRGIIRSVIG